MLKKAFLKIKEWLGFSDSEELVRYYDKTNMRVGFFSSIVIGVFQFFLLATLIHDVRYNNLTDTSYISIVHHIAGYGLLLVSSIFIFIVSLLYIREKYQSHKLCTASVIAFTIVVGMFAVYIALADFKIGAQQFIYMAVMFTELAIFVLHPVYAIFYITFFYASFAIMMEKKGEFLREDRFNFYVALALMLLVALVRYNERRFIAKSQEKIRNVAYHDELTNLGNMNYFRREANKLIKTPDFQNRVYGYIHFDLLNFKNYNEKHGYDAGDIVIRDLADIISDTFMGDSVVARFSGNHFAVLTEMSDIERKIKSVHDRIKALHNGEHIEVHAGIYLAKKTDNDPIIAADKAKVACDTLKHNYDTSYAYFDLKLSKKFKMHQYVVDEIDTAISRGYIQVFYQPVIKTETGEICGAEALARWNDPEFGFLSPIDFIEVLEENRLIHKLDTYIIEQVCRDYDYLNHVGKGNLCTPVSFNLSRTDFEVMDVVAVIEELTKKYKVPKDMVHIEITESALSGDAELLKTEINRLRKYGYEVWMDDFGSGYSSLNLLQDYDFDVIKVDMVFLKNYHTNIRAREILSSVINMAKRLEIKTLAEGVEDSEHFEFLKQLGCEMVQGYYFDRPKPLMDYVQIIEENNISVEAQAKN